MNEVTKFPEMDAVFAEFAKIVGAENILRAGEPEAERLRDEHLPGYETEREPLPSGAVLPETTEQVQAIMRVATEHKVPLWTISMGRNYGYGGPSPAKHGCVTLDLRRMNKILEINEELAYAVVEPGVTPEALWAEIEKRGLALHMDSQSAPWGSLLGNAVDRGVGYSFMADRANAICGMEVVLPDGEILRTGTGALANSSTWHCYPAGFGPSVDGLFQQSNFGVVTRIGLWLIPRPDAFRHAEVYISDLSERAAFIDTLVGLRLAGIIDNGVSGGVNFGGHIEGAQGPGGGMFPPPPGVMPGMRARIGFRGTADVVSAKWQATDAAFSKLKSYSSNSHQYEAPYDYSDWTSEACLAAGIPTDRELKDWTGAHFLTFASILLPATGEAYEEMVRVVAPIFQRYGMPFAGSGFHMHSPRAIMCLIAAPLKGFPLLPPPMAAMVDNDASEQLIRDVIAEAAKHGWLEYRTGTQYMDMVRGLLDFNDNALPRLHDRLKAMFDPAGILSPGKSGIWPK